MSEETSDKTLPSGSVEPEAIKPQYLRLHWKPRGEVMIADTVLGTFVAAEDESGRAYIIDPSYGDVALGPFENMEMLDEYAYKLLCQKAKKLNEKLKPYLG